MAPRVSTTDRIHVALREAILSGDLASGSLHSIYQLAERFEVSRTPVRDAVLRLADAGMLEIERNHGVRVRGLKVNDVREVFEARLLLEVPAAAFAAAHADEALITGLRSCLLDCAAAAKADDEGRFKRSDRQLHTILMQAAGNDRISAMVESLRDATQAHGVWTADQSRTLLAIQHEHEPIVEAVAARNVDAAALLMYEHLVGTAVLLMQQVASISGEAIPEPWPGMLVSRATVR